MIEKDFSKGEEILVRLILLMILLEKTDDLQYCAVVLKVSVRTLERDLNKLKRAGFPISLNKDKHQCHLDLRPAFFPVEFSQLEILSLLSLLESYDDSAEEPFFSSIRTIAMKISFLLSPKFFNLISNFQGGLVFRKMPYYSGDASEEMFHDLVDALDKGQTVFIRYRGTFDAIPIETNLNPYLITYGKTWYVIGYADLYHEIRTFKLGRIQKTENTGLTFIPPTDFNLEKYLGNAWYMIPEHGPDYDVVIHFSKKVACNVTEICWHRTQKIRNLPDGRVEIRFRVSGLAEILYWILGYGAEAEVIEPEELRQLVINHVRKMEDLYSDEI